MSKLKVVKDAEKSAERAWGGDNNGVIHYLLCSKCGQLPSYDSDAKIFVCAEGHVSCVPCGKPLRACPYKRIRNSAECRKLICKMKMSIPQQVFSKYVIAALKDKEVVPKTEEARDKGPLVKNDVTNGLGVSEFEDAPASESTSVLDEVVVTLDRIKIVSSPVPGTSSTLAAKPFDAGLQVGKVETVEVNPKMKITKPNKTDEELKIMSSETIPSSNCSKMLKRLMEKKIAEFDHLPHEEKCLAVRAAVEDELKKHKDKKIKK